ncbi:MAG: tyrosine-type recombinase/integrase, partial [Henriciella sp.]|nr:tyrosine-type recombinase/integrase [Henriciella sp.]
RDRKDPRLKDGNDQIVPLTDLADYDAMALIEEQKAIAFSEKGRIFPYNGRSVGTAFRRACKACEIEDLVFHDLRHEGTSRFFEAGLITGHKDWKMLRRYTHLSPDMVFTKRAI